MSRTRCRSRVVGSIAAAWLLSACGGGDGTTPVGAQPILQPAIYPLPPPTIEPSDGDAHERNAADMMIKNVAGAVLPNLQVTPGEVFEDVHAADICQLHYTQGIRQPRFNAKVEAFANYGVSIRDRDIYQVDHLVPLSLGGSNSLINLWPQPFDDFAGAWQKDQLERQLRGLVCSNKLTLVEAQQAIARDWWLAYETYMGLPIDPGSDGLETWQPPTYEDGEVVNGGPCDVEGQVGYTDPKQVRLTCMVTSTGELKWQKRY